MACSANLYIETADGGIDDFVDSCDLYLPSLVVLPLPLPNPLPD